MYAESELYIDKDACNFAFGVLFVYLLFGLKKYKNFSDIYSVSNKALKSIENTGIYYFIIRCLDTKPEQRAFGVISYLYYLSAMKKRKRTLWPPMTPAQLMTILGRKELSEWVCNSRFIFSANSC